MTGLNRKIKCVWLIVLMMISVDVLASAKDDFKQGVNFFNSENYSAAVKKFESANKQGMRNTALYYNLGSAYFKLKNYKKSEDYYKILKKQPKMKSLAEYNLGLIAVQQKDSVKARQYFKAVVRNAQDKKILHLAEQQLKKITTTKTVSSKNKGSVYLSGSVGYDNNINFAPADIGSEESAVFFDALVSADYLISGTKSKGWTAEGILYTIRYGDTDNPNISQSAFDQDEYGVGLKKTQKLASWNTHLKVAYDKSTFGPRDYQSIFKLEAAGKHKLSRTDRVYLRYRYEDISSDDIVFDYLEGWRQKIRGEFRRYNKNNSTQLYYELELNDRNDFIPATGNQFSYSPARHTLRGKYTTNLTSVWRLIGDLSYRKSDYPSTNTQSRNDERWKAAVYANYRFDKTMKLKLKLEYTDNSSSDNLYVYDRQVVSVSLNKLF